MFLFSQASKFDAIQVRLANKWRELVPRSALDMILGNRLPAGTKLVNLASELTTPGVEDFFLKLCDMSKVVAVTCPMVSCLSNFSAVISVLCRSFPRTSCGFARSVKSFQLGYGAQSVDGMTCCGNKPLGSHIG